MFVFHKRRIILIAALFLSGGSPSVLSGQEVDFCQLFGAVYVEKNPQQADFRVFREESEVFSTVKVFLVDDRLYADGEGLWHITNKRSFADFTIYYESKRGLADFTVFFTDVESFAGCNN